MSSNGCGVPGAASITGGCGTVTMRCISENTVMSRVSNGVAEASISYNTTPSEKISARPSACWPSTCSGDMYFGEPSIAPVWVIDDDCTRAMPKSVSLAAPCGAIMMLAGLMSRCTTPKRFA